MSIQLWLDGSEPHGAETSAPLRVSHWFVGSDVRGCAFASGQGWALVVGKRAGCTDSKAWAARFDPLTFVQKTERRSATDSRLQGDLDSQTWVGASGDAIVSV